MVGSGCPKGGGIGGEEAAFNSICISPRYLMGLVLLALKPRTALPAVRSFATGDCMNTAAELMFLCQAYAEVESTMQHFAKTFYLGSKFFSLPKRKAIWAIYVWCRRTDEIVDGPEVSEDPDVLTEELAAWEQRLDNLFQGKFVDAAEFALADSLEAFPGSSKQPYYDMIEV